MNENDHGDATGWPVSLNNESTPDAAVFAGASLAPTAASTIIPGDHIPP